MKQWLINQSILHPKRTIILSIIMTVLMTSGLRFITVDDDLMKLMPDDLPSRKIWYEIEDEFGNADFMYIAFGKKGENILNKDALSKVYLLSEKLEQLDEIEEVISLSTLKKIVSDEGYMLVDDLIPSEQLSNEEIKSIESYLSENDLIRKRSLSKKNEYINILVRPVAGADVQKFAKSIVAVTDSLLAGYEIHYGGMPYITGMVPGIMIKDISNLMKAVIIIMVLLLLVNLRSVSGLLMILVTIAFSGAAMMGFLGWIYYFSGESPKFIFSLLNSSMPIIILTITNSYGVHVLTHFFRNMRQLKDKEKAIRVTMSGLILPIFMAALTTIIAFVALVFAPITPMAGYGIAISAGIAWGLILSILFIPSLIMLTSWNIKSKALSRKGSLEKGVNAFSRFVIRNPRKMLTIGVIIIISSLYGITLINVEVNTIDFFKPDNSIPKSVRFLDNEMTGSMNIAFKINADIMDPAVLKQIEMLQKYLEKFDKVTLTMSIVDIIKQMHKAVMDDDPKYETIPDSSGKVNNLFTLYSMSGDPDDFSALIDYDYSTALSMAQLKSISTKEIMVMLEDIDKFIKENIDDSIQIQRTGMMVFYKDFSNLVTHSSLISIFTSILFIFIVGWIFFKNFRWGLLAVLPLSGAVALNFGLMGLAGISLNHVISLLTSIIIGVGVDFAVHYIARFKYFAKEGVDAEHISLKTSEDVGYPIALDVVSNLGFGALLFSLLIPLNYMGGLSIFAMFSSSFGTLILLATTIELFKKPLIKIIQNEK